MDRNIVSYLIQIARHKHSKARIYRIVTALLVKLQLANIQSETALSYNEYYETNRENVSEELKLFRQIDSSPIRSLTNFALGKSDQIIVPEFSFEPTPLEIAMHNKEFPKPLKAFEYNFTTMKKAYALALLNETPEEVLIDLLLWMKDTYLFTTNAYFAALIYFSPSKIRKTIKDSNIKKQIRNQTWDLALAQQCKEENFKPDRTQTWLLSSNDDVVQTVYRLSTYTEENNVDFYDLLRRYCKTYWTNDLKGFERVLEKTREVQT